MRIKEKKFTGNLVTSDHNVMLICREWYKQRKQIIQYTDRQKLLKKKKNRVEWEGGVKSGPT